MSEKEPQIVIIGETHPIRMLEICLMNTFAILLINKKSSKEDIAALVISQALFFEFIKFTCNEEIKYLKAYSGDNILVEKPTGDAKALPMFEVLQHYKKMFLEVSDSFGKDFGQRAMETINLMQKTALLIESYEPLEFKVAGRIYLAVRGKTTSKSKFLHFIEYLRETPVNLKLLKEAKKIAKKGGKVLVICGSAHAERYANFLRKFGYNCSVLLLDKPFKKDVDDRIGQLWKVTEKYGIEKEMEKITRQILG